MAILDNAIWLTGAGGTAVSGSTTISEGGFSTTVTGTFTSNAWDASQSGFNVSEFGAFGISSPISADYDFSIPVENLTFSPSFASDNTLYAGGFFGRRSTPDADYLVELALAFSVTDRTRPVKLQWSREDDITGGYYRPAYAHRVRVGLDGDGKIVGWDHRIAGPSIF